MARGVVWYLVAPLLALGLVGCRFGFQEREPWRAEAEEQCVAQRLVQPSDFVEPSSEINGKGTCGMVKPFKVAAVSGGFVQFKPKATLSCPLVANVDAWFHEAVQPAAMAWYGSPVIEIKQISAYSCRTMNGQPGMPISEHAFGNALDIAAFRFADGREVEFKTGWKGRPEERGFLRAVHAAACERFSTVLAPGSNAFHYDHIHVDLARRASGRAICNPAPMSLPAPPSRPLEGVPIAQAPSQHPPARGAGTIAQPPSNSPWAQNAPQSAARDRSTSPWAQHAPQPLPRPVATEREQPMRAASGQPMVLGGQGPATQSFGTQAPLAERVRQALGTPVPTHAPAPAPMQAPPQPPVHRNPYGLVPPGRIPNARTGADAAVTGSTGGTAKKSVAEKNRSHAAGRADLLSAQSLSELRSFRPEPAPVFDLPGASAGNR